MKIAVGAARLALVTLLVPGCVYDPDFWKHPHHPPKKPRPGGDETCAASTHFETQLDGEARCVRKAEQISVGYNYGCAILAGGGLKCWGQNGWRVLGLPDGEARGDQAGEMGDALPFVDLGTGRTASMVAADTDLTCAVLDNGKGKCWGYDGYGGVTPTHSWAGEMGDGLPYSTYPEDSPVVAIDASSGTGFALLADGRLVTVGSASHAGSFSAGSDMVDFALGSYYYVYHMCGLRDDGAVICGGRAGEGPPQGEVGWAALPDTPPGGYPPVELGTGRFATAISLGHRHSCALLDDESVKCWGANSDGQLGVGDTLSRGEDPTTMGDALPAVALGQGAQAIAAGNYHTCAILNDGSVKCWGRNAAGQLGLGDIENRGDAPGEIEALGAVDLGGESAVAIAAGTHTCVILESGAVKCWGPNVEGELGLGDTEARGDDPGEVAALEPVDLGS